MNANQHQQRLDELEKARKLYQESEWRLNFLRTETGTEPQPASNEEILQWDQQHQR